MKRFIAIILVLTIMIPFTVTAFADEENEVNNTESVINTEFVEGETESIPDISESDDTIPTDTENNEFNTDTNEDVINPTTSDDGQNYVSDNAYIIYATPEGTIYSGDGHTETNISVIPEKTADELLQEQLDEMAATFGEEWENWTPPADGFLFPNAPGIDLNDIQREGVSDIGHYLDAGEGTSEETYFNAGDGVFISAQSFDLPLAQLDGYANMMSGLEGSQFRFELPQTTPTTYIGVTGKLYDEEAGSIAGYMTQYVNDMMHWLNHEGAQPSTNPIENLFHSSNAAFLSQNLNADMTDINLGGLYLACPSENSTVYSSLYSYILALKTMGATKVTATKFTVYSATSYSMKTIREKTPAYPAMYRWSVKDLSSNQICEKASNQPHISVLFQSAGSYYVSVFQNMNVTRNNKVGGYKTEIWTLNNGDQLDGFIFYHHTTTFTSFVSDDVGPVLEELQLTEDSFMATVTEAMANMIQMIDENGFLHSATSGFSTERH